MGSILSDRRLGHKLRDGEARDGEHREAAVVELLELEVALHVLGLAAVEREGIEAEIARLATVLQRTRAEGQRLDGAGEDDDAHEKEGVDLVEATVEDGGRLLTGGEEVGSADRLGDDGLEELADGPAGGSKHRKASVLELSLAIVLECGHRGGAVEGVKALVADHDAVLEDRALLEKSEPVHIGACESEWARVRLQGRLLQVQHLRSIIT